MKTSNRFSPVPAWPKPSINKFAPVWPFPTHSRKETKMSANKLSREQKTMRKALKAEIKALGGFIVNIGRVTFVFAPTCHNKAHVAWSICSYNEVFNRKRGELVALSRWNCGETLPIEYGYQEREEHCPLTMDHCLQISEELARFVTSDMYY